jgi:molecular chaperone GrpE (heat shock protein)
MTRPPTDALGEIERRVVALQRRLIETEEARASERQTDSRRHDEICLGIISVLDLLETLRNEAGGETLSRAERRLAQLIRRQGISEVTPTDATPGLVRVVGTRPTAGKSQGTVLEICRKGYLAGDRVLRPAEVITAQ